MLPWTQIIVSFLFSLLFTFFFVRYHRVLQRKFGSHFWMIFFFTCIFLLGFVGLFGAFYGWNQYF